MRSVLGRAVVRLGPARRLGLILLVVGAVPAHGVTWLAGAPASSIVGLATVLVAALLLLGNPPLPRPRVLVWLAAAALLAKLVLVGAPPAGFEGCYQITTKPLARLPYFRCERSYEDPFAHGRTRVDPAIAFSSWGDKPGFQHSNWQLSAVNSDRYDFYVPDPHDRDRLPFSAVWRGRVDATNGVVVTYVGAGSLQLGREVYALPTSTAGRVVTAPSPGTVDVVVRYRWMGASFATTPFAAVRLADASGAPITVVGRSVGVSALVAVLAVLLGAVLLGGACALVRDLARSRVSLVIVLLVGATAAVLALHAPARVAHHQSLVYFFLAVVPWLAARRTITWAAAWRGALVANLVLAAAVARMQYHSVFGGVTYLEGGGDPLAYESFARAILTGGTLGGGEHVFEYSPAMRYFMYLQHMVVGDRDGLILVAGLVGVALGVLFAFELLVLRDGLAVRGRIARGRKSLALGGALLVSATLTFMLVATDEVSLAPHTLRSESPTWMLLLFVLPLAITATSTRGRLFAGTLLGVMFIFRADQSPGLAMIAVVIVVREVAARSASGEPVLVRVVKALRLGVPALLITLLPAAHNLYFGHQLVFVPTSPHIPAVYPLSPLDLLRAGSDPAVRATIRSQLGGVLVIPSWDRQVLTSRFFRRACEGLQVSLSVLLLAGIARRFRRSWTLALLVGVPVAYLTAHVFVQVYYAYPRHIVAGYLAGSLVLLAAVGNGLRTLARPA